MGPQKTIPSTKNPYPTTAVQPIRRPPDLHGKQDNTLKNPLGNKVTYKVNPAVLVDRAYDPVA